MAAAPRPSGGVKLLLDVHPSRLATQRLTAAGYDVVAAADLPDLATLSDEELLLRASAEERAIVTRTPRTTIASVRSWVATVNTTPEWSSRRPDVHRGGVAYPENLIASLTGLLESPPETKHDWVQWPSDTH